MKPNPSSQTTNSIQMTSCRYANINNLWLCLSLYTGC